MIDNYRGYKVYSENIHDIYVLASKCLNCGRIWSGDNVVELPINYNNGFSIFDKDLNKFVRADMGHRMTCPLCEDHKWRLEFFDPIVSRINEDGQYETMDNDEIFYRLNLEE